MKNYAWIGLTLAWLVGATWWWHADEIEQIKFENQTAARGCWKHYDEASPGPDFHVTAEGHVERCYEALADDLKRRLAGAAWWDALAVGFIPALTAWCAALLLMRWRSTGASGQ